MALKRDFMVKRVIKAGGGVVALAKALGLSKQAVSTWKRVPPKRVVKCEQITGIPRAQIRPDIFSPQ